MAWSLGSALTSARSSTAEPSRLLSALRSLVGWLYEKQSNDPEATGTETTGDTTRDVTEREPSENHLEQSERHLKALFDHTLDAILLANDDGRYVDANPAACELLGYHRDELLQLSVWDLTPEMEQERGRKLWQDFIASGQQRGEYTLLRKDGTTIEAEYRAVANAVPGLHFSSLRDITEQRQIEKALRESELSYRRLFDSVTEAIYIQDREGRFLDVNQGALDMYGYEKEELIGQTPAMLSAPGKNDIEQTLQCVKRALEGTPQRFEWWGQRKNGEIFPKEVTLQKGLYFGQEVVIAVARDTTERKEHERQLVEAKEQAEKMNRLKDAFLANMSHEIRTPLTAIIGFSEILGDVITDENSEFAQLIHMSGNRLLDTLNSVLDLARLESGMHALHPKAMDLTHEVQETVQLFVPQVRDRNLSLHVEMPEGPVMATLDRKALHRILSNLLSNALKFTCEGSVTVTVNLDDTHVELLVEDTGVGIAPRFLPHLFDEFKQESSGLDRNYEGSGLGLSITKRLVDLMDGTVEVDSTKGKGTTFRVHLPRHLSPSTAQAQHRPDEHQN